MHNICFTKDQILRIEYHSKPNFIQKYRNNKQQIINDTKVNRISDTEIHK